MVCHLLYRKFFKSLVQAVGFFGHMMRNMTGIVISKCLDIKSAFYYEKQKKTSQKIYYKVSHFEVANVHLEKHTVIID